MLTILYSDSHIAVCVKPAGVLSQDAGERSMPGLLKSRLKRDYVVPVHRLDQAVGGVMVYALSEKAAASLSRAIQEKELEKTYLAVLRGTPEKSEDTLEDLLFHDRNRSKTYVVDRQRKGVKDAKLSYAVLEGAGEWTLVKVRLYTGRTHQIWVQFASRKLPLVGDGKYGGKEPGTALGLWSWKLAFPHPVTKKTMEFTYLPPNVEPWEAFSNVHHES